MRKRFIPEYKEKEMIEDFFLVRSSEIKNTRAGSAYGLIVIADAKGNMTAKKWSLSKSELELFRFLAGSVVLIKGEVQEYKEHLELNIAEIRLAKHGEYEEEDIVKTAPMDREKLYEGLRQCIETIEDEDYKKICETIYDKYKEKILIWPAGKSTHHDELGGLMWHTYRMSRTGHLICQVYKDLNRSLLVAAILLHDIGKIVEMMSDSHGAVAEYSVEGDLLGHLIIGIKIIEEAAAETGLPEEKKIVLEHMIAAHHGEVNNGSLKEAKLVEAFIINKIDLIDMYAYLGENEVANANPGEFTEKAVYGLDKRKIYRPGFRSDGSIIQDEQGGKEMI